jgi:L-2-hydroxyglutarate oxidase LhgO
MRCGTVVIGAGVCGLAAARALALTGREVLVIEAERSVGTITSSRNSEVVHGGIYYSQDSLKARLCVEGRRMMYDFCDSRGVPHARCGKLIVATSESQLPTLDDVQRKAGRNGLTGADRLRRLSSAEARALEPNVSCVGALLSPSTGVVDSHALMSALMADDAFDVSLGTAVRRGRVLPGEGILLECGDGQEVTELLCGEVVNSAGLAAPRVARSLEGVPPAAVPAQRYAKVRDRRRRALAGAAPSAGSNRAVRRATTLRWRVPRPSAGWSIRCRRRRGPRAPIELARPLLPKPCRLAD